ncbi:MAG: hypothetical protein QXO74_04525 [Candidatus Methanomethylicia archaeon]
MKIAIVYYSKTGTTRSIVNSIWKELEKENVNVRVFELKHENEYANTLLHLNLRLIYETLSDKTIKIVGDEEFHEDEFNLIIIGSPIWYGRETPIIRRFIKKYANKIKTPIILLTTSKLDIDYSKNLKMKLEAMGYNVISNISITTKNVNSSISLLIEELKNILSKIS